jgi:rod shape determining protein RodA
MLLSSLRFEPAHKPISIDYTLLLTLLLIATIGLFVLYSASGASSEAMTKQGIRLGIGLAAFVVIAQIPPRYLRVWTPWIFIAVLGLLLLVMVAGEIGGGAQRWLNLGLFGFQPSEFMKLAVPMMVAWFLHDRTLPPNWSELFVLTVIIAVPALLILKQPDLGGAILTVAAGGLTVLLAGISVRLILTGVVASAMMSLVLWFFVMLDYQRARVLTFLNPWDDPDNGGWNIIQSQIALGSGGVYGKGWLSGTQAHLDFLPESDTDFIFSVMGEEFGLLGLVTLLVLYLVLVGRGLFIAASAQDTFTRLVAGTLSLTFFFYVFVNAGMVSGLMPVVGVPLPLVSAGGTSMVTLLAGFGILAAIGRHRKLLAP